MKREQLLGLISTIVLHGILILGLAAWKIDVKQSAAQGETASGSQPSNTGQRTSVSKTDTIGSVSGSLPGVDSPTSEGMPKAAEPPSTSTAKAAKAPSEPTPPTESQRVGSFVVTSSYSWSDGSKRKKVSGALPKPSDNVSASGNVTLDVVVSPNGTVKSMKAVPSTRTGFEREAVRQVRRWRFEVLPRSQAQRDQNCVVTFLLRKG